MRSDPWIPAHVRYGTPESGSRLGIEREAPALGVDRRVLGLWVEPPRATEHRVRGPGVDRRIGDRTMFLQDVAGPGLVDLAAVLGDFREDDTEAGVGVFLVQLDDVTDAAAQIGLLRHVQEGASQRAHPQAPLADVPPAVVGRWVCTTMPGTGRYWYGAAGAGQLKTTLLVCLACYRSTGVRDTTRQALMP